MTQKRDNGTLPGSDPTEDPEKWRQKTQYRYEAERDGDLTTAIVFAVADARNVAPSDLKSPPLYDCIDAAALEETLFGPEGETGARQGAGTVEFRYTDNLVTVASDGWIQVYERVDEAAT
ncbi:hypothetical protein KTS45_01365 [Halomicroarcula limicola]|uniref:Halobacterial output domain-containing protein n=1 Tax=Haloarcula limicola TaxID=1429915 RepID=A0A8J7Y2I7_9EURY|nr:HalOD1 output domain-containing protein [Halomicroarcula limicola]MBV0922837.1 hypothetical protein [Halomicroarcula limicola]